MKNLKFISKENEAMYQKWKTQNYTRISKKFKSTLSTYDRDVKLKKIFSNSKSKYNFTKLLLNIN